MWPRCAQAVCAKPKNTTGTVCGHGFIELLLCDTGCLQVYVVVLGYSLIRNDQLPPATELTTIMKKPELQGVIAEQLEVAGFVTPEQLGQLKVRHCVVPVACSLQLF
jgi:hypothetical protein